LVFNVRELPLAATLLEAPGCIPAHRHTRFAPLLVPERVRAEGPSAARSGAPLGPLVPNLSPAGLASAAPVGGPREAFRRLADRSRGAGGRGPRLRVQPRAPGSAARRMRFRAPRFPLRAAGGTGEPRVVDSRSAAMKGRAWWVLACVVGTAASAADTKPGHGGGTAGEPGVRPPPR